LPHFLDLTPHKQPINRAEIASRSPVTPLTPKTSTSSAYVGTTPNRHPPSKQLVHFLQPSLTMRFTLLSLTILCSLALSASAQTDVEPRKKPPLVQVIPEPRNSLSFLINGTKVLGLDGGFNMRRPFLYPVLGPSGIPLTRMGHPHDPISHSHHNSIWISHNDVAGTSFWADNGGTIETVHIARLEDADDHCAAELKALWKDKAGNTVLTENRRITLTPLATSDPRSLPNQKTITPTSLWRIDIDSELIAPKDPVVLGATAFGFLGVRMAKTIGVHDGGGRITNSEGGINEKECFRKPARWVDYSGPITANTDEGITLMDHPKNLHHPVEFHVRGDGWMGAATTFRNPHSIEPNTPLRLRHGLLIHSGSANPDLIENEWKRFATTTFEAFGKKKP
jgi:hypothetical protein